MAGIDGQFVGCWSLLLVVRVSDNVEVGRRAVAKQGSGENVEIVGVGAVHRVTHGGCQVSWRDLHEIAFQLQLAVFLSDNLSIFCDSSAVII